MGKTLAEKILKLVRYANVESQRPLVEETGGYRQIPGNSQEAADPEFT